MNLSERGSSFGLSKQSPNSKGTCLNPNAAEFIPLSLRASPAGTFSGPDPVGLPVSGSLGKQVLDRSESKVSTNSDEEARQYWRCQLPDDITPDFKVIGEEDPAGVGTLSLAGLSLEHEVAEDSPANIHILNEQDLVPGSQGFAFGNNLRHPLPSYSDDPSLTDFLHQPAKSWEKQVASGELYVRNGGDGTLYEENRRHGFLSDMVSENVIVENNDVNPIELLTYQFPGFAAESLAEVYFANGCDLNMTFEILTQLELQADGDGGNFNPNASSQNVPAPNLSSMEFPALSGSHNKPSLPNFAEEEVPQTINPYRPDAESLLSFKSSSSSLPSNSRGSVDFASAVRRLASQDSGMWKHERSSAANISFYPNKNSPACDESYVTGASRSGYTDRLRNRGSIRSVPPPVWLETGEAVANMYSELREEARDCARLRNACFEQARQAYLLGNKALAKELGAKGQMYNAQMKAAHNKAQESIYRQRNPSSLGTLGSGGRGGGGQQERLIDLHGLHVSEAVSVLRNELAALRGAAATVGIHVVYICVGTGHHTKGSRTPARLPVAVQRYLLEEGLDYSEPQPGLIRVLLY